MDTAAFSAIIVVPPHTSQFLKMCEPIMLPRCHYFGQEIGILGSRGLGASVCEASLSTKVLSNSSNHSGRLCNMSLRAKLSRPLKLRRRLHTNTAYVRFSFQRAFISPWVFNLWQFGGISFQERRTQAGGTAGSIFLRLVPCRCNLKKQ